LELRTANSGHVLPMMWVSAVGDSNHEQRSPDGEAAARGKGGREGVRGGVEAVESNISERSASAMWWRTREECAQTSEVVEYDGRVGRVTEERPSEV
jgi:hypothetical protein